MAEAAQEITYTVAQYLEQEEASETKHEFLDGRIYDMAGGTPEHALCMNNVGGELRSLLRGRPCRVYSADMRVYVQATGLRTYPDVSVVCGKPQVDVDDKNAVLNPIVLVEVLSKSTEAYDRGEKFAHYRRIPSLREYVLVSTETKRVEVFRRGDNGVWSLYEANDDGSVELTSIGCKLALPEVYLGVFEGKEAS